MNTHHKEDSHQQVPVILLTGATSGIGEALCIKYAALGWLVIACGRNTVKLATLAEIPNVSTLQIELDDAAEVKDKLSELPPLDLVILNAGTCEYIDDAKHFDGQLFSRVIQTNLISVGYCLEALLPSMKKGSQLALVGSSASFLPFSRAQAYGASKAGIAYLANCLAIDLETEGIDVSLIRPGFVKTPLTDKNDFNMPMTISSEQAANYIIKGLSNRTFDIHFPKKFTFILKVLSCLPTRLWHQICTRKLTK